MSAQGGGRHYQRPQERPKPQSPPPVMQKESGNAASNALADVVDRTAAPFQNLTNPDVGAFQKAQGVVGAVAGLAAMPSDFANDLLARATDGISKTLPSWPAATMMSLVVGIPHLHAKPPALPWPLPGIGAVMTSCPTVQIGGLPAARSGDYGLGPTCGSLFPIFEIFTGSSKVFIGGARAARAKIDFTRQCMPGPPKGAGAAAGAASKAAGAASKMQKVAKAVQKVEKVAKIAGFASMAMGVIGVDMRAGDTATAADAAEDNAEAAMEDQEATDADRVDAAAEAKAAAAEAAGAALAASMMGQDLAMTAAQMAMGALMGKDPGTPPCIGMIVMGNDTVRIGGFPMPSWSDLAKGLKKLINMLAKGRRGGAAMGKWFCFGCMKK